MDSTSGIDEEKQPHIRVSQKDCPSPHSLKNKLGRTAWGIVWFLFFQTSPRPFFFWRRFLLRIFGANVGVNARVYPGARIWAPWNLTLGDECSVSHEVDCYCIDSIMIGNHSTVSQYARLLTGTHDIRDPNMKLITKPIRVEDGAWICAGATVLPGITIGEGAVVGAAAVVTRDVPPWVIVAGNPATVRGQRRLQSNT